MFAGLYVGVTLLVTRFVWFVCVGFVLNLVLGLVDLFVVGLPRLCFWLDLVLCLWLLG